MADGDEHLAPNQPSPAINDEPAHFPRRIVKQKIDDSSDSAIACLDREAFRGEMTCNMVWRLM
jgi:hypothetical protein